MSIKPRGKSFQVSVSKGDRRIRKQFPTFEQAEEFQLKAWRAIRKGEEIEEDEVRQGFRNKKGLPRTFGAMADFVYENDWKYQKSSDHTYNRVMKVVKYFGEDTLLKNIQAFDLDTYKIHLRNREKNSPATINRKLTLVSKILNYALRYEIISSKPAVKLEEEPDGRLRWYTRIEEKQIITSMREWATPSNKFHTLADFFTILIDTGMRRGELLSIQWDEIDFKNRYIVLGDPGKNKAGVTRSIPMTTRVFEIFTRKSESSDSTPFNFSSQQIDRFVQNFKDKWSASGDREFEIDDLPLFHTCRHTFISRLIQSGRSLVEAKTLAGHRNIQTTLRYSHLAPKNLSDAIDILETYED